MMTAERQVLRNDMSIMKQVRLIGLVQLLVLLLPAIASACPGCSEGLDGNLIRGYFWSIIFMMSMPFLILGGLSSYLYLEVRRARARQLTRECGADGPEASMTDQREV